MTPSCCRANALSPPSDETFKRLAGCFRPSDAAAGLVAILTDSPEEALLSIRLCDVAADGSAVTVGGHRHPVPAQASKLLRAQVEFLAHTGADDDAPFLTRALGTDGFTVLTLRRALAGTGRATGLTLSRRRYGMLEYRADWAHEHGIEIDPPARTPVPHTL